MPRAGHYQRLWADVPRREWRTYGAARAHLLASAIERGDERRLALYRAGDWIAWDGPADELPHPGGGCLAAVEWSGLGLWYPCRFGARSNGFCHVHGGGLMPKFEACPDDTTAEIVVPLGTVTLADLPTVIGRIERAAARVHAPTDAEVTFDSFTAEAKARVKWTVEA